MQTPSTAQIRTAIEVLKKFGEHINHNADHLVIELPDTRMGGHVAARANEFEVTVRTIMRDVDFMKCRINLPIEFNADRNGYYYTRPVEQFPQLPISEAEVFALLVAHKAIAQYHGTPFERPLEMAFRKLTGQLDRSVQFSLGNLDEVLSFRPFAPEDADLENFQIITRGLKERRELKFLYRNLGADKAHWRQVRPYHLACVDNHW